MNKIKLLVCTLLIATCLQAQKTPVKDVYIDNNNKVTISFLSPKAAMHGLMEGVLIDLDSAVRKKANVALHYPIYGRVSVSNDNGAYRITVYNIYFQAGYLALPIESFALTGKRLTRNKKRLKSVVLVRGFIYKYFTNE